MDISVVLDPATIILFLFILWLTYIYLSWPYGYFKTHGIPGPKPVPVLGNWVELGKKTLDVIDREFIDKYGKVFGIYNGWDPELIISDIELIKQFTVKQADNFTDRRDMYLRGKLKHSISDQNNENWKRTRHMITPAFSSGKLKLNSIKITSVLKFFMESLNEICEKGGEIEAKHIASCFTADVICSVGFGVEVDCLKNPKHPLVVHTRQILKDFDPQNPWFMVAFFSPFMGKLLDYFNVHMFNKTSFNYICDLIKSLIKQKQGGNTEAEEFVTALLRAHEEQLKHSNGGNIAKSKGMTEEEIIGNGLLFILAGYDTTATGLSFLLYELTINEDCQDRLYQEIIENIGTEEPTYENMQKVPYLDWCIDEALRLHPPIVRIDRKCIKATTIGDISIPKGMLLTVPVAYLHKLPDIWPDPEKYDPLRFSPEVKNNRNQLYFLPFGIGPRQCVGMRLAMLEMKMATAKIIQNFELVKNHKTVPFVLTPGCILPVAKNGLWFSVKKRVR